MPSTRADSSIRDRTWNAFRDVDDERPASATAFVMMRTSDGLRNATFFAPMVGMIQFRVTDSEDRSVFGLRFGLPTVSSQCVAHCSTAVFVSRAVPCCSIWSLIASSLRRAPTFVLDVTTRCRRLPSGWKPSSITARQSLPPRIA